LDHVARQIQAHQSPRTAGRRCVYILGQLLTEDYYVFNKLAKGLVGARTDVTRIRAVHVLGVAGYKQSLGADAPPCAYEDIDAATDPGRRLEYRLRPSRHLPGIEGRAREEPGLKVIAIDPRATVTDAQPPTLQSRAQARAPMSRFSTRCSTVLRS
jgi:anaerobic selenocysteine-containing dehydrogenase